METKAKCCAMCKHFRALARTFEREDGAVIYGYCFKGARNNYSVNMGKGYPVWLPPSAGASCKDYQEEKPEQKAPSASA